MTGKATRIGWIIGFMLLFALVFAACQPAPAPAADATADKATTAPEEEATEEPAEETTAEPAEEAAEAEATEAPVEEATAEPEEEATAQPEEEMGEEEMADDAGLGGDPEAGGYVFAMAASCSGCHFNRDLNAAAGGNRFEGPFGVVHTANITQDEATGLGAATDQQIADAIRFGKGIDGRNLFLMPKYAAMSDEDVANLVATLRTLEPVENAVPAPELAFDPPEFTPQQASPATAPTEGADRGRYIATLSRCGFCHTPSNEDGSSNMEMLLAGAPFRDTVAPNLTPDELTGLGSLADEEILDFLTTGVYDDGTEAHRGMKSVVDRGTGQLTDEDRMALVAFLRSLPPVENLPEPVE